MVELSQEINSYQLAVNLLTKYNILIKDLSHKINSNNFIRLAIRNERDNNILIDALKDILEFQNINIYK